MIYGADRIVQMPVMQLYDTGLMLQAILNARYMYDKAEKRMDDFYKEYDNFVTPIQKDQDWYNENVIGRFRRGIDELYANGEDPLRTATGRAKLAQLARSIDVGTVNKLRTSALNADEFLKERARLEAQGLYNPILAKYDGPDINSYSTLESGAWDKMSPTRITDMATFGNPYYEGMRPNSHSESRNGISYSVKEITMNDLKGIADAHFNELVSTPQGQLMYKYYTDVAGGDKDAAREMFNNAVADGQRRRIFREDDYNDQYFQHQNLNLKRQQLALQRENLRLRRAAQSGDNGGPGTQLNGISLAQTWYNTAMAKAWSADGITKDVTGNGWFNGNNYAQFGKESGKIFSDFGKSIAGVTSMTDKEVMDYVNKNGTKKEIQAMRRYSLGKFNNNLSAEDKKAFEQLRSKYTTVTRATKAAADAQEKYRSKFSIPMDGESIAEIISTPSSENKSVGKIKLGYASRLYGTDDVISNTSGYRFSHETGDTKMIRAAIKRWGERNTTVAAYEEGYGSLRKNGGSFEVMPRVKVTVTDDDGNIKFQRDAYVDISLGSIATKGGAYLGDYKDPHYSTVRSGEGYTVGNVKIDPDITDVVYHPGKSYNMYPDINRWTGFGVWDTDLTSKKLHAKASESLGTYLPGYSNEGYDPFDDIIIDEE